MTVLGNQITYLLVIKGNYLVTCMEPNSNQIVTKYLVTILLPFSYLRVTKYKLNNINNLTLIYRYLVTALGVLGNLWEMRAE